LCLARGMTRGTAAYSLWQQPVKCLDGHVGIANQRPQEASPELMMIGDREGGLLQPTHEELNGDSGELGVVAAALALGLRVQDFKAADDRLADIGKRLPFRPTLRMTPLDRRARGDVEAVFIFLEDHVKSHIVSIPYGCRPRKRGHTDDYRLRLQALVPAIAGQRAPARTRHFQNRYLPLQCALQSAD